LARNRISLPSTIRSLGDELLVPGRMSFTWKVPAAVPSLRHS
jgi:hypothetical protein